MNVSIHATQAAAARRIHPSPSVAIVGATGAVGTELLACLERRCFPLSRLKLLASPRSAGRSAKFQGRDVVIDALGPMSFEGVDVALFSAGSAISKEHARRAAANGTIVIDNSSAFRMNDDVPLVVPEINPEALAQHRNLIANPNCTGAISMMALWPLHREFKARRVIAATYQAASGAGAAAMEELRASTEAYLADKPFEQRVLPHPYAFNVFSHNDKVDIESGENGEEIKVAREMRKVMNAPDLAIGITCVRVPVFRAHTVAMTIEFERKVTPGDALETLKSAPGVDIVDDRAANRFPMPREASGRDNVVVGRLRQDKSDPSGHSLSLMVAGDQLLKGAALNAVQIAEELMK